MSTIVAQNIRGLSTNGVQTFKRPQVHLMSNVSPDTYTIANNDFSYGGNLALLTNSTAVDFTYDAHGALTPTHAGLYLIYAKIYLYFNTDSGVSTISGYRGGTGTAPYDTQGTYFANLETFEWNGRSGRIDKTLTGTHVEYISAGERIHFRVNSGDYYLGPAYHACGMIKLD